MGGDSKYKVTMHELEAVHIPAEELVEEHDVTPPVPDAKSENERLREATLRVGAPGL